MKGGGIYGVANGPGEGVSTDIDKPNLTISNSGMTIHFVNLIIIPLL